MLSQVVDLIVAKERFAITSHVRPDGDGLGSSLGLYWLLREFLPAITQLRDVSLEDFRRHEAQLPEPVRSRCRHVVTEDERTVGVRPAIYVSEPGGGAEEIKT